MSTLPADLRRLLAVEPRIVDVVAAERSAATYPGIDDAQERIAEHTRRLTGQPGRRPLNVNERWWRGELAPLENPVVVARDCAERWGFPEADVCDDRAVWLRRVDLDEDHTP